MASRGPAAGTLAAALWVWAGLGSGTLWSATISEPDTVLYGRVINRAGPVEELVTQGVLTWGFRLPGGGQESFSTSLQPLLGGLYCYELRVPHSLAATGLQTAPRSIPLPADETSYGFAEIRVNGAEALIVRDELSAVAVSQQNRAQAIRVDLELREPMADSDGDGLPDWWEEKYGMDPFSAADATVDVDGDGLNSLEEFLAGLSPLEDNRIPRLARTEYSVYLAGVSGLPLRVVDTDTAAEDISVVLTRVPEEGALVLRDAQGGRVLRVGSRFTAADANMGLVEFRRDGQSAVLAPRADFEVALSDGGPMQRGGILLPGRKREGQLRPGVAPEPAVVRLRFFRDEIAPGADVSWEVLADSATVLPGVRSGSAALRSKAAMWARYGGCVVWDLLDHHSPETVRAVSGGLTEESYLTGLAGSYGPEAPVVLLGGTGPDYLEGGFGDDILFGGAGEDVLVGNGGADRFIIDVVSRGDRIEDFDPEEGDQLDLSRLFAGVAGIAEDYLRVIGEVDGGTRLEIRTGGVAEGEPDVVVRLTGYSLTPDSLADLVGRGSILLGDLTVMPLLTVEKAADAAENGLKPGSFLIRRGGSVGTELSMRLGFSGSATAGVDYQALPETWVFPAGVREMAVLIHPYSDALSESAETVRVEILESDGYHVGRENAAELVIRDLAPELSLSVVRSEASFSPSTPAVVRVNREELMDRQIVVELVWSGTAALTWVEPLPQYLEFGRGESTRLIEVRPKSGQAQPEDAMALTLRLAEHSSYLLAEPAATTLLVLPGFIPFEQWAAKHWPARTDLRELAGSDPGAFGLSVLERFAFNLDPAGPDLDSTRLPRLVERNGRMGLEFVLRPGLADVGIEIERSGDLRQWNRDTAALLEVELSPGAELPVGWRRFEGNGPHFGDGVGFFRVRLRYEP
ncbi:MAG TPA: type I secretion C-terminal target domain-containing protein [Verrucomicrobiales bacterium]|nr:type I secretion C-terminal target domain-containing protein [Verrucomicrobiales bacterium]